MIFQIQNLLDESLTQRARAYAEQSEFTSGSATNQGSRVKNNEQINQPGDEGNDISNRIVQALFNDPVVAQTVFPKAIPAPTFSRYQPGMYYGLHMDEAVMSTKPKPLRTDASVTVFLSGSHEYEGGELEIWTGGECSWIKMEPGDAVIYPTGLIHQVRPIASGTRYAAVSWMQSYIPELKHRQVLSHFHQLMDHIDDKADETDRLLLQSVRTSLYRM